MVSRDLTCDETMPPLDDGDNIIGMRMIRSHAVTAAALIQQNHHQQQQLANKLISHHQNNKNMIHAATAEIGPSRSTILVTDDIGHGANHITTVRDVVTRQIKNSKLKNEYLLSTALNQFDGPQIPTNQDHHHHMLNASLTNHNRHTISSSNGRMSGRKNAIVHHNNDALLAKQTASVISNTTNYILPNTGLNSSSVHHAPLINCHPLPIGSHHLVRITTDNNNSTTTTFLQPIIQAEQLMPNHNNNHWAQQQPDTSVLPVYHQHSQPHYQFSPKKSSNNTRTYIPEQITNTSQNSTIAYSMEMPLSSTATINAPATNSILGELPEAPNTPNHSQQQNAVTTPHSSPRPSILRGNNPIRRLTDRDRPASVSSVSGVDTFGNGLIRVGNCASQGGEDFNGSDESPRKRVRKQLFGDSIIPDKIMMELNAANPRHEQNDSAGPSLDIQQQKSQPSTLIVKSSSMKKSNHLPPKKRGRPKLSGKTLLPVTIQSTSTFHSQKSPSKQQLDEHIPNSTQLQPSMSSLIQNGLIAQTTGRVLVNVDSILQEQIGQKRKYRKRNREDESTTGEIMKKERKKGSGRKSKREMELAAQQQRETAILAGVGMVSPATTTTDILIDERPSTSSDHQFLFPNMMPHNASHHIIPYDEQHSDSGNELETNAIHTLCRLRRDSEHQQHQRAATTLTAAKAASMIANQPSSSTSNNDEDAKILTTKLNKKAMALSKRAPKRVYLPLLNLLKEFSDNETRHILKNCDKALSPAESNHLTESYKELTNLLGKISPSHSEEADISRILITPGKEDLDIERISEHVSCPIFDSYEQFQSAMNHLRLLPKACAYFDTSQRLLHSLRTNLAGHLFYKLLNAKYKKKNIQIECKTSEKEAQHLIPISALKLKDGEKNEEVDQMFQISLKEISNGERRKQIADLFDGNGLQDDKLLLQLDVAQKLDSLLDRINRDNLDDSSSKSDSSNEGKNLLERKIDILTTLDDSDIPVEPIYTDVLGRVPSGSLELLKTNQRRLRKRKLWESDDEDEILDSISQICGEPSTSMQTGDDIKQEEQTSYHKLTLNRLRPIFKNASSHLTQIERIRLKWIAFCESITKSEARPLSSQMMELRKQDVQKKRTLHKSNQFLFRPPSQLMEELLKHIADWILPKEEKQQEENPALDNIQSSSVKSTDDSANKKIGNHKSANNGNRKDKEYQDDSSNFVMEDLIELLANSEHISASSLAQLNFKYPDILSEESDISLWPQKRKLIKSQKKQRKNAEDDNEEDHEVPLFKPTICFEIPSDSLPEEQKKYIKARISETQEIYTTAMNLFNIRSKLANQSLESINEISHGDEVTEETTNNNEPGVSESREDRHQIHRGTPDSPAASIVIPAKRAAHWRALNNIQSANSRAGSISRGSAETLENG